MHINHRRKNYQKFPYSWRSSRAIRRMFQQEFRAKVKRSLIAHPEGDMVPHERELLGRWRYLY